MDLFDCLIYAIIPNGLFFVIDFVQHAIFGEVKYPLDNYYLTNLFHVSFITYLLYAVSNYGG